MDAIKGYNSAWDVCVMHKLPLAQNVNKQVLQAVRQRKLLEMESEGIPAKYRAELARKKMTNW